jgi:peptide/nickel transport system permease protein
VLRYVVRRVLWAGVLFLAVTLVTYVIFFIIPANPANLVCGRSCTPQQVHQTEKFLGLDDPVYVQYGRFLKQLVVDRSLGRSFATRRQVNDIVAAAAPVTASLVLGGIFFAVLWGVSVGIVSALRPRSLLDRAAMVFILIGISAHPVWIGLILAYFLGFKAHLFPITGYCDFINPATHCGGPVQWAYHLILPWATFMVLFAALYTRLTRANVLEIQNEDYVRTARAKGAPESRVLRSHILRNALLPLVTILGMDVGLALAGAVFTESVYGLPGLGRVIIQSLENFDLPVTQGVVVFATLAVLSLNLVVDVLYAFIDPRIRLG